MTQPPGNLPEPAPTPNVPTVSGTLMPANTHAPALLVVDSLAEQADGQQLPQRGRAILERLAAWEKEYAHAHAPSTVKAVRADWQVFVDWCRERGWTPMPPIVPEQLMEFLDFQLDLGKKRSTLTRYINTLRLIHDNADLPDPTGFKGWKLYWKGLLKRLKAAGMAAPVQAEPMQSDAVQKILASLGDKHIDLRDAALISLASDTLCRQSELVRLRLDDFKPAGQHWSVDIRESKTDQQGLGDSRFCSRQTKALIDAWCLVAGIADLQDGAAYLFVQVGRTGMIKPGAAPTRPLRPREVARIIRRRALQAGVEGGDRMSGHSGRVGSAIDLIENGATVVQTQFSGGWQSEQMVLRYAKRALAGRNAMAALRDKQGHSSE